MAREITLVYLNPRDLLPSRRNVRSDPGDLAGLAETIREHGVLQPLGIVREGDDYRIVYGNRRREASIVVGLDRVPCMILDNMDDDDVVVQQVLENLQRLDLNDLDKSRAFEQLLNHLTAAGASQSDALESIARTLGLSTRQIQRYLRLQQLYPAVQQLLASGDLGVTHAQHLVDIDPASRQEAIALLAVEESLSAAELSRLVAALSHNTNIDPHMALEMLRRGERIAVVEMRPKETLSRLTAGSSPEPTDNVPWDDDEPDGLEDDEPGFRPPSDNASPGGPPPPPPMPDSYEDFRHMSPTTQDGNRVRRIHSLDSFMDELQRLSVCVQEGDLQRMLGEAEGGKVKIRLAARQLRFLADAVEALSRAANS